MIRLLVKNAGTTSAYRHAANARFLSQSATNLEKAPPTPPEKSSPTEQPATTNAGPAQAWQKKSSTSNLNAFDKKVLVWSGKYKSVDEVPESVARETMDRARDKFRVKACIYMMLVCIVACVVQILRGKSAAERGESVVKSNLEWHRQYNESAAAKEAATKK